MQIDRYVADRRKKQKKRRKYFWGIAAFLAIYFIALGIFVLIVRSPAFQAERITVEGNSAVSTNQIMDLLHASILRRGNSLTASIAGSTAMLGFNNLFIWPNALPSSTVAAIPQLAGITISKNYFLHSITVTVTERQPFGIWCLMPADDCYWFDNTGDVFEHALDTQGGAITVIHDYSSEKLSLGDTVLPEEFMPELISILAVVKQSDLNISNIALNDISLQEIDVKTAAGPLLKFSLRFSADEDWPVLQSLIAKPGFDKLQYIDFTVPNRAFYK